MLPDERERLIRLEVKHENVMSSIQELKTNAAANSAKLDQLVTAAHMGRGAWWLLLRVGGLMVLVASAVAWIVDKLHLFGGR